MFNLLNCQTGCAVVGVCRRPGRRDLVATLAAMGADDLGDSGEEGRTRDELVQEALNDITQVRHCIVGVNVVPAN